MPPNFLKMPRFCSYLLLCLALRGLSVSAQSPPVKVLALTEITATSFRGRLSSGVTLNSGTTTKHPALSAGHTLRMPTGTRIDFFGDDDSAHALFLLQDVGGCMITRGSSLRLPTATETDMTVTFDRHISDSPNVMLLNVNAAEVAKRGGAVFRTKNKFTPNSAGSAVHPKVVLTTLGGRFFMLDQQGTDSGLACTVGVLDGSATVEEITSGKQMALKAGQVVVVTPAGIGAPRLPTKGEQAYDIGCKAVALGREMPASLPASMKVAAPTTKPGTHVNSLGMVFVPVPGTKILMCVHETRWGDFAPYLATMPALPNGAVRARASGYWGWNDHPVITTWEETQTFCNWLSQKEGKKYRLPTDEEWSHAVGIGTYEKRPPGTTPEKLAESVRPMLMTLAKNPADIREHIAKDGMSSFAWGREWPPPPGSGNFGDASFHAMMASTSSDKTMALYDDGFATTAPVMSFKPNKLGIYDLIGNVGEWCDDWYDDARQQRLVRGGPESFRADKPSSLHPAKRQAVITSYFFGFRLVLEQP